MQELSTHFNFKARYYKVGQINDQTKEVWFVLHGYGQLAKYFISKFQNLTDHNVCVIAPEGLSRFYMEDVVSRSKTGNNRVGATWMTRENRLMDIENYIQYLNTIYHSELLNNSNIPVTIVGFSQGAATASRWVLSNGSLCSRLILWAGIFPNDVDFQKGKELLKEKEVQFIYGSRDPFLTEERLEEMKDLAMKLGVSFNPIIFDGDHTIHEPTLLSFI